MKANYNNKMQKPESNKALHNFYYPDLWVTVQAESKAEADKMALAYNGKNAGTGKRKTTKGK